MIGKLLPEPLAQAISAEAARHEADPVRRAQVLNVLVAAGFTINEVAEFAGTDWLDIEMALGLLVLADNAKGALAEGALPLGLAERIAQLSEPNQQLMLNRWLRGDFKSERHAERYAAAIREDEQPQVSF